MYHFESSNSYCSLKIIEKTEAEVSKNFKFNEDDKIQLNSIVKLEKLRCQLFTKKIEMPAYRSGIKKIEKECVEKSNRSPFDPFDIHDVFYETINSLLKDE